LKQRKKYKKFNFFKKILLKQKTKKKAINITRKIIQFKKKKNSRKQSRKARGWILLPGQEKINGGKAQLYIHAPLSAEAGPIQGFN